MELFALIILVLIAYMIFRRPIRQVMSHGSDILDTEINESKADLIERSMAAYDELVERCGEDFQTPHEIWQRMNHKGAYRIKKSAK